MSETNWFVIIIAVIIVLLILVTHIRVVKEYDTGVVFRFGKIIKTVSGGLVVLIPIADRMQVIDSRILASDVAPQEVITRDNVTLKVDGIVWTRIDDAKTAVRKTMNIRESVVLSAQALLRDIVGKMELDEVLQKREEISRRLQQGLKDFVDGWGIEITKVDIKQVVLPDTMKRSMAAQAEAERDKRAKIIVSEGELAAAQNVSDAAKVLSEYPNAIQLRYLQTLREITTEKTNTVIFPIPLDMLSNIFTKK